MQPKLSKSKKLLLTFCFIFALLSILSDFSLPLMSSAKESVLSDQLYRYVTALLLTLLVIFFSVRYQNQRNRLSQ